MRVADDLPARQAPGPLLVGALSFWAACAALYSQGRLVSADVLAGVAVASAAAAIALGVALAVGHRALPVVAACCIAVGCFAGSSQAGALVNLNGSLGDCSARELLCTALEDSRPYGNEQSLFARIDEGNLKGVVVQLDAAVEDGILQGTRFSVETALEPLQLADSRFAWQNGCVVRAHADGVALHAGFPVLDGLRSIRANAIAALEGDAFEDALLQAIACGYRANVRGVRQYSDFQTCGLAHLIAVSGAHLVVVTGLFASTLKALRVPRRLSIAVLGTIMAAYLVFSGMPVSALRATIMSSAGISSLLANRRPSSCTALALSVFAIVGSDPSASVSASLVLSGLSTLGIVLVSPLAASWFAFLPTAAAKLVGEPLALTFSANIASQLVAASMFNQVPLVAPAANVVAAPLFPLLCAAGLLSAAFGAFSVPGLAEIRCMARLLSAALCKVVSFMASWPYACAPFSIEAMHAVALSAGALWVLWKLWPSGKTVARALPVLIAAAIAFGGATAFAGDRIVMLDVGQGDAFLLQSRNAALLIDTGNQDARLLQNLAQLGVAHLDGVLVTHGDDDHCGSLDQLARSVVVDSGFVSADTLESQEEGNVALVEAISDAAGQVVPLRYGDVLSVGNFTARVVWPHSFEDGGGNADSLCLNVAYDGDGDGTVDARALFTGDAEKDQVRQMVESGDVRRVDVLKVGHHGSKNALYPQEAAELQPDVALIGVGANNRYGHPAPATVDMLEELGCKIFRSDEDGMVEARFTPEAIIVTAAA